MFLTVAAALSAGTAQAQTTPTYIGEIKTFAFLYCPENFVPLNGQLLSVAEYPSLFSLLGTTYGGDGRTTFGLPMVKPDRDAKQNQLIRCIAVAGEFPARP
mgnify:FL=1